MEWPHSGLDMLRSEVPATYRNHEKTKSVDESYMYWIHLETIGIWSPAGYPQIQRRIKKEKYILLIAWVTELRQAAAHVLNWDHHVLRIQGFLLIAPTCPNIFYVSRGIQFCQNSRLVLSVTCDGPHCGLRLVILKVNLLYAKHFPILQLECTLQTNKTSCWWRF